MNVLNLTNIERPFYRQQISSLQDRGVKTETLTVPGAHTPNEPRRITDYLRFVPDVLRTVDEQFDLVHANNGLTAPMALAQRRLPVVLTLWGTDVYGPYGWVSRSCARFCDEVVVMSERMHRDVGQECTVIPHGVDLDRFRPIERERARAEVGWDHESHHVLFPYETERPEKDYPRARRVVDEAARRLDEPVDLDVVTGVPHEKFVQYLNAADSLLMTSKYEGSPNVVKEALACRLPVVSTDVGDVRDRLTDVDPSFVATDDPGLVDALVEVLERGDRSNGRETVQAISLDRTAERLLEVYERALADH